MHAGKQAAAQAALAQLQPGMRLGVGTGSTTNLFIDALAASSGLVEGAVASSEATATRLRAAGIEVLDLNASGPLDLYVDGADEVDPQLALIKGGGGALTREKIVAGASTRFVCIVDDSKQVKTLGTFPVPIEVIPMARSHVARQLVALGADPEFRDGPRTDNGNQILDCHGLRITDPAALESRLNDLPGVVCVGLFALRRADQLIVGHANGRVELANSPISGAADTAR